MRNEEARVITPTSGSAPYVLAKHLNIGYSGEIVVPDISFELGQGQAVALIGTNGSGKSTLLKPLLACSLRLEAIYQYSACLPALIHAV